VTLPVDRVAGEQRAEDHQLGGQEHPHAERGGLVLLAEVREVVRQRGLPSRQLPPPPNSGTARGSRAAGWGSWPSAAAAAAAIPGRSPATGSAPLACRSRATRAGTPAAARSRRPRSRRRRTTSR